jgi:hypothetical protein
MKRLSLKSDLAASHGFEIKGQNHCLGLKIVFVDGIMIVGLMLLKVALPRDS